MIYYDFKKKSAEINKKEKKKTAFENHLYPGQGGKMNGFKSWERWFTWFWNSERKTKL
jgi:hypothetical protein